MRDFRTYARAEARLGPGLTVVHGPNGAGKSNLLEAIYFGCTGRSPRTRNERELVRFGAQATPRRRASSQDDAPRARAERRLFGAGAGAPAVKRMSCRRRAGRAAARRPVRPLLSVFLPDRLELIKGPPALRRAHLDQFVAALWPAARRRRAASTRACSRSATRCSRGSAPAALRRRHARRLGPRAGRGGAGAAQADRAEAVGLLAAPFAERAQQLGLVGEPRPRVPPALARGGRGGVPRRAAPSACESDLERGFSGYGPHRDELAIVARRPRAARLRLAGRAAARPARAAARRACRARRRARHDAPDAARRRDERARRRAVASCSPASSPRAGRA